MSHEPAVRVPAALLDLAVAVLADVADQDLTGQELVAVRADAGRVADELLAEASDLPHPPNHHRTYASTVRRWCR